MRVTLVSSSPPFEPGRHRGAPAGGHDGSSFLAPALRHHRKDVNRTRRRAIAAAVLTAGLVASPALTEAAVADSYTVRPGDTLAQIAQDQGTTWQELYQLNRRVVSSPNRIYVGQALNVDGGSASPNSHANSHATQRVGNRSPVTSSSSSFGQRVLGEAAKVKGVPYVYGGTSPEQGFDCSDFTSYVFAKAGKTLPRTSGAQAAASQRISGSELRAGDLIFFSPSGRVSHVAIYAGNGMVWEAPSSGKQVRYAPMWDVPRFYGRI